MKLIAIVTALSGLALGAPQFDLFNYPFVQLPQPVQPEPVQQEIASSPYSIDKDEVPDLSGEEEEPSEEPSSKPCVQDVRVGDDDGFSCCPSDQNIQTIAEYWGQSVPYRHSTKFKYNIAMRAWTDNGAPGPAFIGTWSCYKFDRSQ